MIPEWAKRVRSDTIGLWLVIPARVLELICRSFITARPRFTPPPACPGSSIDWPTFALVTVSCLSWGCGSGLLTGELIAAGHRVIATDASPAILKLAAELVGDTAQEVRQLTLPIDPLPRADAIVAVGHPLNYLASAQEVDDALLAIADALTTGREAGPRYL